MQLKKKFLIAIIFISILMIPVNSRAYDLFYVRTDIKVCNGAITEKKLLMIPADNDFRIREFKLFSVTGKPDKTSDKPLELSAEHNALINLLENEGLKSIQNKSIKTSRQIYEETIQSFEGIIKVPYKKITSYDKNGELEINLEILFTPIASPDKWSYLFFKKKVVDLFKSMISIFY